MKDFAIGIHTEEPSPRKHSGYESDALTPPELSGGSYHAIRSV